MAPHMLLGLPAPAKLNLFLHVLGRRPDGYHEIQSVFAPIDLCDTLDFESRTDGQIIRQGDLTGPGAEDLAVRAARALQQHAAGTHGRPAEAAAGATISVTKRIPVGAGLGGGSSDAATALIALNRLWSLGLSRSALAAIGRQLGADVPFFLGHGPALVEGAGERCTGLSLPASWYVVVYPQVAVSTAEIFADPKLTRDGKPTTIAGFSAALSGPGGLFGANDLEPVVRRKYACVDEAVRLLARHGSPRMSGSGSAVFCAFSGADQALAVAASVRAAMPPAWGVWGVAGLAELPLADW